MSSLALSKNALRAAFILALCINLTVVAVACSNIAEHKVIIECLGLVLVAGWAAVCIAGTTKELVVLVTTVSVFLALTYILFENPTAATVWLSIAATCALAITLLVNKLPYGDNPSRTLKPLYLVAQIIIALIYVSTSYLLLILYLSPRLYQQSMNLISNFPLIDLRIVLIAIFTLIGLAEASAEAIRAGLPKYAPLIRPPRFNFSSGQSLFASIVYPMIVVAHWLVARGVQVLDLALNCLKMMATVFFNVGLHYMAYLRASALDSRLWHVLRDVTLSTILLIVTTMLVDTAVLEVIGINRSTSSAFSLGGAAWGSATSMTLLFTLTAFSIAAWCLVWSNKFSAVPPSAQLFPHSKPPSMIARARLDAVLEAGVWLFVSSWIAAATFFALNKWFQLHKTYFVEPGTFFVFGLTALALGMLWFIKSGRGPEVPLPITLPETPSADPSQLDKR